MASGLGERGTVVVVGVDGSGRTRRLEALAEASGLPLLRLGPDDPGHPGELGSAAPGQILVLVDDAHRLDPARLSALTVAVRAGHRLLLTRRPVIASAELADLDGAVAATGRVEQLRPLDREQTAALVTEVTGRECPPDVADAVQIASGGLPALAVAVASMLPADPGESAAWPTLETAAPALVARVQRRLAVLGPAFTRAAEVLSLRLDLSDDALARACGHEPDETGPLLVLLRNEGFLVPDGELLIPAVAQALLSELPPGRRRRIHDDVARALVATGAPALQSAAQLRSARARGPAAGAAYLAAAEQLRFTDPAAALGWYDDAQDAGADSGPVRAGRAEAGALLGLPVDLDSTGMDETSATRLALAAGAAAAHDGRAHRAADLLLAAGRVGPVLAVPSLIGIGRLAQAQASAASGPAPQVIALLAAAALASSDPGEALPLAIEAGEAIEQTAPSAVLPDTPHSLGAVLSAACGDVSTAGHLLENAVRHGIGGPGAQSRHRLLSAWAWMRAGHLDPAREQLRLLGDSDLNGRDRVLRSALRAGLARRSGDIPALLAAWPEVERVLARRGLDLFQLEAAEELAVAAARLRRLPRLAPSLAALEAIVADLGSPPDWEVALGWLQLQVAVANDDAPAAKGAAARIGAAAPSGVRRLAQQEAAAPWAAALAGDVDPDLVVAAAEGLAAVEMPWEASRLAGDAAIRVADPVAARRLLECARDLAGPEPATAAQPSDPAQRGGLSDREIEVSRLVLAGRTHREIGAQLYIAPKTVEHHVARIRTKLGARTRAEFVAALQSLPSLSEARAAPPTGG